MSLRGKVLRLNDDGSVPDDNPFVSHEGHRPEIYTFGHRNTLGLILHPETGELWQHENGPNGGDEINIVLPGRNYGWPVVSFGRDYSGARLYEPTHEGMEDATSGLAARHRGCRHDRLHRRRIPCLEGQRLRGIPAPGWNTRHGSLGNALYSTPRQRNCGENRC